MSVKSVRKTAPLILLVLAASLALVAAAPAETPGPESVTDIDGNTYRTVRIGAQIWMAENLRTTRSSDGSPVPHFTPEHGTGEGLLYTTEAALRSPTGGGPAAAGCQGISPEGWHIPSAAEWQELIDYLGGEDVAGGKLKAAGCDRWQAPNKGANDVTGFSALPLGWHDFTGEFKGWGAKTFLRSSTPRDGGGDAFELNHESAGLKRVFLHPDDAIPVRCIKDR